MDQHQTATELELPRLASSVNPNGAPDFRIESPIGIRAEGHATHQGFANVVQAWRGGKSLHILVAQVGGRVVMAEFTLPEPTAEGERKAESEIDRDEVPQCSASGTTSARHNLPGTIFR